MNPSTAFGGPPPFDKGGYRKGPLVKGGCQRS